MTAQFPIVTWTGRVHYRDAEGAPVFDSFDRLRTRPYYAALCNPNTVGMEPIHNKAGDIVAREGYEAMTRVDELPVCKRCAKKVQP